MDHSTAVIINDWHVPRSLANWAAQEQPNYCRSLFSTVAAELEEAGVPCSDEQAREFLDRLADISRRSYREGDTTASQPSPSPASPF